MSKYIGIIGGTGRVGQECARYLQEHVPYPLLLGARNTPKEAIKETFCIVDVFNEASLDAFCQQCFIVVNCSGPATRIQNRIALAALKAHCHFVDAGGYSPMQESLSFEDLQKKERTFLLGLGILPGLSEIFPAYLCNELEKNGQKTQNISCYAIGRDAWTYTSAWDIAWGVGHIGQTEGPVYYENGQRKEKNILLSGKKVSLPQPVGKRQFFRLMRQDFQSFIEKNSIPNAHTYGNNWGTGVCMATVLIRILGLYKTPKGLDKAAKLIMKGAKWDMRGKKPGFMLHVFLETLNTSNSPSSVHSKNEKNTIKLEKTLYFEDTYRATALCAAIGTQLVAKGMASGVYAPAQLPNIADFMELFLAQGYTITTKGRE